MLASVAISDRSTNTSPFGTGRARFETARAGPLNEPPERNRRGRDKEVKSQSGLIRDRYWLRAAGADRAADHPLRGYQRPQAMEHEARCMRWGSTVVHSNTKSQLETIPPILRVPVIAA